MAFPDTFEEFIKMFQFIDKEEIYTNKAELIPVFRVMQGWEHFNIQSTMIEDEIKEKFKKEIYEELFALTCKWKDN